MSVTVAFVVGVLIGLCLADPPRTPPVEIRVSPAARSIIEAARELVARRRWFLELPPDRPLPARLEEALDRAIAALDAEEATHARG